MHEDRAPELTAHLRRTQRRLKAALRQLRKSYSGRRLWGDALIARDLLREVKHQRRRPSGYRSHWMFGRNGFGPQVDALCALATKGGSFNANL